MAKKTKHVLIVEDEKLFLELSLRQFSQVGWKTSSASSVTKALVLLKEERPDIVLLDMILAESTGLEFLQEKNKDKTLAKIPVLVFSNLDEKETREKALTLGAKEYLIKTAIQPKDIVKKALLLTT